MLNIIISMINPNLTNCLMNYFPLTKYPLIDVVSKGVSLATIITLNDQGFSYPVANDLIICDYDMTYTSGSSICSCKYYNFIILY